MVNSLSTIPNIAGHASLRGGEFSDHILELVIVWNLDGQFKVQ